MKKLSVKLRVTIWYTVVMLVISVLTLFAVLSVSEEILIKDASERLVETTENMSRMISEPRRDDFNKMPGPRFFDKGVHTAVYDQNHELMEGSMPFDFVDEIDFADKELNTKRFNDEKFLIYTKSAYNNKNEQVWVVGVISVANETSMLYSVGKTNLCLMIVTLLVAAIGGYLIVKKALLPVNKIAETAKEISESTDLSQRICLGDGKDEIYTLANTFDEMLQKIENTLENEKNFTSDASHELRTPIAVIETECEYAIEYVNTIEEAKETFASIKRQSDKMSKLVSELLAISRMDKNTVQLNRENINLSELTEFVCDEQEEINGSSIKLSRDIDEDICVNGDRLLLTRLLINLISNAYAYGKENGNIFVSVKKDGKKALVNVKDDGIGIAEENLEKIWERFYQVDPSRTSENNSMGLGLSMVKWIAEKHDGKINVKSRLGEGSEFIFEMPLDND